VVAASTHATKRITSWLSSVCSAGGCSLRAIAAAVQEGAQAYLNRQYITIGGVGVVILVLLAATLGMTVALFHRKLG
jgi:K(+)-stimulated pyrophosphate-energized sodium pump